MLAGVAFPTGALSISVGVACRTFDGVSVLQDSDVDAVGEALFRAADMALYAAKRGGRNRISTAEPLAMGEPPPEPARQPDPDALHTAFQEAFNRHDLDAVVSLSEPTAVLFSSGAVVQGANGIRDFYRRLFELKPD